MGKSKLKPLIKAHDRIIMMGHGTEKGLLSVEPKNVAKFFSMGFLVDSNFVYLLREKLCVCIWCNADVFFLKYGLKGFYTGMIVSEPQEALLFCERPYDDEEINSSNKLFASAIKQAIDSSDMLGVAKSIYVGDGNIVSFNKQRLYESK